MIPHRGHLIGVVRIGAIRIGAMRIGAIRGGSRGGLGLGRGRVACDLGGLGFVTRCRCRFRSCPPMPTSARVAPVLPPMLTSARAALRGVSGLDGGFAP